QGQGEGGLKERTSLAAQVIPEGERNDTLTRIAGAMWRQGVTEETLVQALLNENETRCVPPLPEAEVKGIARSVARYPQGRGTTLEGKGSEAKAPQPPASRLRAQSARTLVTKCLPPVRWVVHGLIPEGVTLLAGDAKIGKSWAALTLGCGVATGDRVFGYFDTVQGDVLYL